MRISNRTYKHFAAANYVGAYIPTSPTLSSFPLSRQTQTSLTRTPNNSFPSILQLSLNRRQRPHLRRPNLHDPKPGPIQQHAPLLLAPFHAIEDHHVQVDQSVLLSAAGVREDDLGDEERRAVRFEGVCGVAEDRLAVCVGPVVQDAAEVVPAGALRELD
jgi:hypothetical protein